MLGAYPHLYNGNCAKVSRHQRNLRLLVGGKTMKTSERINLWKDGEYNYPHTFGFVPNMVSYLLDDGQKHPCVVVVPGGGYEFVSPTEGGIVAEKFNSLGYNAFVVTYTINMLKEKPLMDQPMRDLSRAIRLIRKNADEYGVLSDKLIVCGFSAGAHLSGSVCVHFDDVREDDPSLAKISCRPNAAILSYPVITSGESAHRGSFDALIGTSPSAEDLEYYSLEKNVTENTPPTFIWQTMPDDCVPVENSYLYDAALREAGVNHALHIFSAGRHGLSLGDKTWADRDFGDTYCLEQIHNTTDAVRKGLLNLPEPEKEEFLTRFNIDDSAKEVVYPEVTLWPELADAWLKVTLKF